MASKTLRISIPRKILLIAASFSIPIGVLVYLMVASIDSYIEFGTKETYGNAFQRPLEDLLNKVQEYHVVIHTCQPPTASCRADLERLSKEIASAHVVLAEVQKRYGEALQFTKDGLGKRNRSHLMPASVQAEWQRAVTADLIISDAVLTHFAADIRGLISHSGDTSNLILDPDLDSYYMMDVTLLALPQTQDRLAQIIVAGLDAFADKTLSAEERTAMAVSATMLQEADIDRIAASTQTALLEDINFYGTSPSFWGQVKPALEQYLSENKQFVAMLRQLSTAEKVEANQPQAFLQAGLAARAASFRYWTVAVNELDKLLNIRIGNYQRQRTTALFSAALALLVASLLAWVILRSITLPLGRLVSDLGRGEALLGECVDRVYAASEEQRTDREEALSICKELSNQAVAIRNAVKELTTQVRGRASE